MAVVTRTPRNHHAAPQSRGSRGLGVAVGASLVVSIAIAVQIVTIGSGSGNWVYGYVQPFSARIVVVGLLVAAAAVAGIARTSKTIDRAEWTTVLLTIAGAMLLQLVLRSLTPSGLNRMFASTGANAFYEVALTTPADAILRDFDKRRLEWPLHARSNMPGKVLFVSALETLSARPRVLAWLLILASDLGGLLFYAFVRDWYADRRTALFALVLYLFVPGKLVFFPLLNTMTPVVVTAWLFVTSRWLRTLRLSYALAAGIALYGILFFEPLPLVMGVVPIAFAAHTISRRGHWSRLATQSAAALAAFAAVYALFDAAWGFDAIRAFRELGAEAVAFNESAGRPYGVWVVRNLLDFAFATGIAQIVLFAAQLAPGQIRLSEPNRLLSIALAAVLLLTDLAGVNRGEVVRLWIFLACFFQIPTAWACARLPGTFAISLVVATTVLQAALGTATIGFVVP